MDKIVNLMLRGKWVSLVAIGACSAAAARPPVAPPVQEPEMPVSKALVADPWPSTSAPAWEDPWTVTRTPRSDTYSAPPRKVARQGALY